MSMINIESSYHKICQHLTSPPIERSHSDITGHGNDSLEIRDETRDGMTNLLLLRMLCVLHSVAGLRHPDTLHHL